MKDRFEPAISVIVDGFANETGLRTSGIRAGWRLKAGLFLSTLSTLMFEILLTRIFSVTMWYHFAFMAVSIAMFGLTIGGMLVYLLPCYQPPENAGRLMAESCLGFAYTSVISILFHAHYVCTVLPTFKGIVSIAVTYGMISIPFVFSGICVCLALTKYPAQVGSLYCVDLAGAATGCVLLILILNLTDAISAVFVVSCLAALAAALMAVEVPRNNWFGISIAFAVFAAGIAIGNSLAGEHHVPPLRLKWTKEGSVPAPLYERWNSYSRVTVANDWTGTKVPNDEGLSTTCIGGLEVPYRVLKIDSSAETTLLKFGGDLSSVGFLKCDVKDAAFALWQDRDVLVVGAGGGRDILAALAGGERSVEAVEINTNIVRAVNGHYGNYTGHLDRDPRVKFVNDEARSYIARSRQQFGIIQISFIDTWAATAAGGFALTENSLYTLEAWNSMLNHLTPGGVLSVSRWYVAENPLEAYRLVSLAAAALVRLGARDPRGHLIMLAKVPPQSPTEPKAAALTLLVGRSPFSQTDLTRVEGFADRLKFEIILSPRVAADPLWASLTSGTTSGEVLSSGVVDLSPPTDDRPFFFQMFPLRTAWRYAFKLDWVNRTNSQAVTAVVVLLIVVSLLTVVGLILPLVWKVKAWVEPGALTLCAYFAAIGLGFMMVEVSQMERLVIFLGHPTFALSTVLFTLLLSAGLGSSVTQGFGLAGLRRAGMARLGLLVMALAVFGLLTPFAIRTFAASSTPTRVAAAVGILFPLGFFLGMAFPLGMMASARRFARPDRMTPWFWGINGATSVLGSVLALAVALEAGIAVSFWTGLASYAVAFVAFHMTTKG